MMNYYQSNTSCLNELEIIYETCVEFDYINDLE